MSIMEDGVELAVLWAASFNKSPVSRENLCSTLIAERMLIAAGELLMETWGFFSPVAVEQLSLENLTAECDWWPQPSGLQLYTQRFS